MTPKRRFFDSRKARISLFVVSIFLLVIGAIFLVEGQNLTTIGNQEKEIAIMTMTGELMPFEVDMSKPFEVNFGSNLLSFSSQELADGIHLNHYINLVNVGYPVQINVVDNKLSVSADIKNADNVSIAKIVNNQWAVSPDPLLLRDRNYNAYAFEAIDSDLIPVLQVIVVGENNISIGFSAHSATAWALVNLNGGAWSNPSEQTINEMINSTLFKYPSRSHLGEMINPVQISDSPLSEAQSKITSGNILQVLGIILTGAFSVSSLISGASEVYATFKKRNRKKRQ